MEGLLFPFQRRRQRSYVTLSFSEEMAKKLRVVLQFIFGREFLSPHTTIVSGIENYPSPSMSCWSDDLAQLLPC